MFNGYFGLLFKEYEEVDLVNSINNSGAHILLLGMSSPKKEMFIDNINLVPVQKAITSLPALLGKKVSSEL